MQTASYFPAKVRGHGSQPGIGQSARPLTGASTTPSAKAMIIILIVFMGLSFLPKFFGVPMISEVLWKMKI
jgi:hypothetical protein